MYPNNDPVMFMVAFYGCLLAEVIPVPIEVPLTRKVTIKFRVMLDRFSGHQSPVTIPIQTALGPLTIASNCT